MSLELEIVEVFNLSDEVEPAEIDSGNVLPKTKANGMIGQAVSWNQLEDTYTVHTVDGLRITIPNTNLRVYETPAPQNGGFDLFWPQSMDDFFDFAAQAHNEIVDKSWCLLQTSKTDSSREEALGKATRKKLTCPRSEFHNDYLGKAGKGKVSELDPLLLFSVDDVRDEEVPSDSLSQYDKDMSDLFAVMGPMTWDSMGFRSFGRTESMVWLPLASSKEGQALEQEPLTLEDIELGVVERHLHFVKRRKLCFMYFVNNSGGTLSLQPRTDTDLEPVILPISKGKMVVFRCDLFRFEFNPQGEHLTLMSWILEDAPQLQMLEAIAPREIREELQGLMKGPRCPYGVRPHVMALAQMTGGTCHNWHEAMMCYTAGTDSHVEVPALRFDVDAYFSKQGEDDFIMGRNSYHRHGGLLSMWNASSFDPLFFGMNPKTTEYLQPNQRKVLEVGYDALFRGGHTKKSLKDAGIMVSIGDCNNEWWHCNLIRQWAQGDMQSRPDVDWWEMKSPDIASSRLSFVFGMRGPCLVMDTACSSGLAALNTALKTIKPGGKDSPTCGLSARCESALAGGVNIFTDAIGYVGAASQHMLSVKGRCFTFDQSADGFARGEGASMCYTTVNANEKDVELQMGCAVGTKVNQDGRSASMTAPNGPAQQLCIKASMQEAGLEPHDITASECHGTGTALGDPIEVGSLRGVQETDERENGLSCTSSKSNLGHLEANAGTTGFFKCILMSQFGCSHPNLHLRTLNAHLDQTGWPSYFQADCVDYGQNSGLVGVSSFGVSGTNTHSEVYGICRFGVNAVGKLDPQQLNYVTLTCPVTMGPIDHLTGEAVPRNPKIDEYGQRAKYHANCIRDELESYDVSSHVYKGGFRYRQEAEPDEENLDIGCNISICGSWTGFTIMEDMELEEDCSFTHTMVLGDTRCESFYLCINGDQNSRIYPAVNRASQLIYVQGPDEHGEGKRWIIDGRDDETPAGVIYQIRFSWKESRLEMAWSEVAPTLVSQTNYQHTYSVSGTWTANKFQPMKKVKDEEGVWESTVKIGLRGREEFHLGRDNDEQQSIYPSMAGTEDNAGVYACGPDDLGIGRRWVVTGVPDETFKIRLETEEAKVVVKVTNDRGVERAWESTAGPGRHSYCVVGSWSDYAAEAMTRDPENPHVWGFKAVMGQNVSEEFRAFYELFQIQVDGDPNAAIYPQFPIGGLAECTVEGPDGEGPENLFVVKSPHALTTFEIVLDLKAVDRRKIVTWKWEQKPVYDFRGGSLQLSVEGDLKSIGNED